jgi:hypothetical protein
MRVEITSNAFAYAVRLSSADRRDFGHLLSLFKSAIPDNCRRYDKGAKVWRIERRAARSLDTFKAMARDAGAVIVEQETRRKVVTLAQMARPAQPQGDVLTIADTDDSADVLVYSAKRKAGKRPALVITRHDRWASLRGTIYGGAMNDQTKRRCFEYLIAGCLPGGLVRVSNRELLCTRLSFHLANEMSGWLLSQLTSASSIIAGDLNGREHSRYEATKQSDGKIKMAQSGGARRAA